MVTPTLGALATIHFLGSWNSYLDPLIFLSNWRLHTLPLALNQFIGDVSIQYNLVMAACCLAVIPVFVVFLLGQKFFVKGLTIGSVKG
jgi:multiple sugar transport system permease protein